MPNTKLLKFGEDLSLSFGIQLINASAAVRGDDFHRRLIDLQQPRNEGTTTLFQMAQHADLVFETFTRKMAAEGFVDSAVVPNPHKRSRGVFDFVHDRNQQFRPAPPWQAQVSGDTGPQSLAHAS